MSIIVHHCLPNGKEKDWLSRSTASDSYKNWHCTTPQTESYDGPHGSKQLLSNGKTLRDRLREDRPRVIETTVL